MGGMHRSDCAAANYFNIGWLDCDMRSIGVQLRVIDLSPKSAGMLAGFLQPLCLSGLPSRFWLDPVSDNRCSSSPVVILRPTQLFSNLERFHCFCSQPVANAAGTFVRVCARVVDVLGFVPVLHSMLYGILYIRSGIPGNWYSLIWKETILNLAQSNVGCLCLFRVSRVTALQIVGGIKLRSW